ncbi:MAG: hypothetical protein QXW39_07215 [Candidatus Bathyarchaeia archaeon]
MELNCKKLTEPTQLMGILPFLSRYNFLFKKIVLGNKHGADMVPPVAWLDDKDGAKFYVEIRTLLGV